MARPKKPNGNGRPGVLVYHCRRCRLTYSGPHIGDLERGLYYLVGDKPWPDGWGVRPDLHDLHRCTTVVGSVGIAELVGGTFDDADAEGGNAP
jgi:hypothetical protein